VFIYWLSEVPYVSYLVVVRTERHTSYGFTSFTTSVEYVRLSFVAMNKSVSVV